MKLSLSAKKLLKSVKDKFEAIFGAKAKLCDCAGPFEDRAKNPDAQPHCTISVSSKDTTRCRDHPGYRITFSVKNSFKIAPIQSLCGGNLTVSFPVPGGLDVDLSSPAAIPGPSIHPEFDLLDDDSKDTWDRVI